MTRWMNEPSRQRQASRLAADALAIRKEEATSRRLSNHYVYGLIPPRPSFHEDMNEEERAIMSRHAAYWSELIEQRGVVVYGPWSTPAGPSAWPSSRRPAKTMRAHSLRPILLSHPAWRGSN